jgi:hypothetical protein
MADAMNPLPWRTFDLPTGRTPSEAASHFARNVGEAGAFRGTRRGELHFEVSRVIAYRNSFLPVIHVAFEPATSGSIVRVRMRLNIPVLVFMIFWMTFATLAFVVCTKIAVSHGDPKLILFGAIFPIAGAVMTIAGFNMEASRAEALLRELFSA